MPVGKPPDELFILNGAFRVAAEADGNKVLELPGNPLDSFGVLFGPEDQQATEVSARVAGTNAGRMFPEFGVGANDAGGWKLWVLPGQDALVLRKKEADEVARVPFKWASGRWTHLKLRVSPAADGTWLVQGKAWPAGGQEPAEWTITATTRPPRRRAGRACGATRTPARRSGSTTCPPPRRPRPPRPRSSTDPDRFGRELAPRLETGRCPNGTPRRAGRTDPAGQTVSLSRATSRVIILRYSEGSGFAYATGQAKPDPSEYLRVTISDRDRAK
jgi:hypothetical protein